MAPTVLVDVLKGTATTDGGALNTRVLAISCLERGTNHDRDLAQRYRDWIQQQEAAS